jgi:chemotaxis protein CheD
VKALSVGIGKLLWSDAPDSRLVAWALGSCVGVAIWDPQLRMGGMLHSLLPDSNADREKSRLSPLLFADCGIEMMLAQAVSQGMSLRRVKVWIAGGARMDARPDTTRPDTTRPDTNGRVKDAYATPEAMQLAQVGPRNIQTARRMLWQKGLLLESDWTGGSEARDLSLIPETGECQSVEGRKAWSEAAAPPASAPGRGSSALKF